MDSIIIRTASQDDFEDIFQLSRELGYTYPKDNLKERIRYILNHTRDMILVAAAGQEVVGYIHGSPYELLHQDSILNVLGFVVKEKNRGSGIGHQLMIALETKAKENGFNGLRLTSGSCRTVAHRFYERHGFINQKTCYKFMKKF